MLKEINLLEKMINIIMHGVTSVESNVKLNGVEIASLDLNVALNKMICYLHIFLCWAWIS